MNKLLQESILSTLVYFDLFSHPLNLQEITQFLHSSATEKGVKTELNKLVSDGMVYQIGPFFSLRNKPKWIKRRERANHLARKKMITAQRMSRIIASMPYVRSILLSGTIAKGVMYEDSDIDYFIITKSKRLWIAKLFVVLFKKIFLFNSKKNYCVNYFLSEERLEIKDQNLYIATEFATLIPTYNLKLFEKFRSSNQWIHNYFPNFRYNYSGEYLVSPLIEYPKKWLEKLFNGSVGDRLDKKLMKRISKMYKENYQDEYSSRDFENNFRSTRYASKVHKPNHMTIVLDKYERNKKMILEKV